MIKTMIGTAAMPLTTALKISALIGSSGEKLRSAPTSVAPAIATIEGRRPARALGEPDPPAERLAKSVSRAPGQNRHREQSRADDAEREDHEGQIARDGLESLRGVRRGFDVRHAVCMERRRGRQHDEKRDHIGKAHANHRVEPDALKLAAALELALRGCGSAAGSSLTSSTSSDACQKNR